MNALARLPDDAFVVRPDLAIARSSNRAGKGAALLSALALTCCGLAFGLRSGVWLFGLGFFGGGALLLAHITLYFRNASVFASETKFGKTTAFGRLRSRDRSQLARVVLARVSYGARYGPGRPEMYFLDRKEKPLLVVEGTGLAPGEASAPLATPRRQSRRVVRARHHAERGLTQRARAVASTQLRRCDRLCDHHSHHRIVDLARAPRNPRPTLVQSLTPRTATT